MSGVDLCQSVLDDCSRPGHARIAPQAKKFCEIRANYDGNLLKLSVRQPVRGVTVKLRKCASEIAGTVKSDILRIWLGPGHEPWRGAEQSPARKFEHFKGQTDCFQGNLDATFQLG